MVEAQRRGYDLALDAATSGVDISEAWIRRIEEEVCGPQETFEARTPLGPQPQRLPKGVYKTQPNHVVQADGSIHAYASVDTTPGETHRLVTELRSQQFQAAHPVHQASFADYGLAAVHPFADGNGRVARILASVYLLRAVSVPLVVFADQRGPVPAGIGGRRFRAPPGLRRLRRRTGDRHDPATRRRAFRDQPSDRGGVRGPDHAGDDERRASGARGPPDVGSGGRRSELSHLPTAIRGHPGMEPREESLRGPAGRLPTASGHQAVPGTNLVLETSGPMRAGVGISFDVAVADELHRAFPLLIMRVDPYDALPVRGGGDVHPMITDAFRRRLSAWAERMVQEGLAALTERVESQIQSQ